MKHLFILACSLNLFATSLLVAKSATAADLLKTAQITSSLDNSPQPSRYFVPAEQQQQPTPLVVALHSWSADYKQNAPWPELAKLCQQRGWAMILPNFRGPNVRPPACGSDLAIQDVVDAIEWIKTQTAIDPQRVFLVGASGGGHMALQTVSHHPKLFASVSAWVPPTDLVAWHAESKQAGSKYWRDIEAVCGGPPGTSDQVDATYQARSPLVHLDAARGVPIDLNVGIHDGHTGSIPVTHTLRAFNRLAAANDRPQAQLSEEQMHIFRTRRTVPAGLEYDGEPDPVRSKAILFRRQAGPVRVTVFDGGHEGDVAAAVDWFARPPAEKAAD